MVNMVTTRATLEDIGFGGFVRFAELPTTSIPVDAGVYAVLRCTQEPPVSAAESGWGDSR